MVAEIGILFLSLFGGENRQEVGENIERAREEYTQAYDASTFYEQQKALSTALATLLVIDTSLLAPAAAVEVEEWVGDIYAQRGEEVLASLHYRRGLARLPWDRSLIDRLNGVLQDLNLPQEPMDLTLPIEWIYRLFFVSFLAFLTLFSVSLWVRVPFGKMGMGLTATVAGITLVGFFLDRFFAPVEGIVMETVSVEEKSTLTKGKKVFIVKVNKETQTFSVVTKEGIVGVIEQDNLRLV